MVANVAGSTTSLVWNLSFVARPTAPYQAAVLADQPIGYWPLNEADHGSGNGGVAANDYLGARNGVYTNTVLAQNGYAQGLASQYGYTPATDSETSALFGNFASPNSDANSIYGVDFSAPSGSNVTFSVEAWVKGTGPTTCQCRYCLEGLFRQRGIHPRHRCRQRLLPPLDSQRQRHTVRCQFDHRLRRQPLAPPGGCVRPAQFSRQALR